jgi:hypothetical protein
MLVRLMYASRAAESLGHDELSAIVKKSQTRNVELGVTGVLCFSGGVFLQALEGGRNAVNALYNKITQDRRHHDVVLLIYDEVPERRFAGWSMGSVNLARINPAVLLKYSETAVLDPYAVSGKASLALFDDLVATAAIGCSG